MQGDATWALVIIGIIGILGTTVGWVYVRRQGVRKEQSAHYQRVRQYVNDVVLYKAAVTIAKSLGTTQAPALYEAILEDAQVRTRVSADLRTVIIQEEMPLALENTLEPLADRVAKLAPRALVKAADHQIPTATLFTVVTTLANAQADVTRLRRQRSLTNTRYGCLLALLLAGVVLAGLAFVHCAWWRMPEILCLAYRPLSVLVFLGIVVELQMASTSEGTFSKITEKYPAIQPQRSDDDD